MVRTWPPILLLLCVSTAAEDSLRYWRPANRKRQQDFEALLDKAPDTGRLHFLHGLLATEPHRAGSRGDLAVVKKLVDHFRACGMRIEEQELWVYLAVPVEASLELVAPDAIQLPVRENAVDDFSGSKKASFGWNAYSGSGDVTAGVVYANYGRKEDYARLKELGVDVKGKIVVARYGGNFRGYKAKFAEKDGAVGLVIYTDPGDSGYARGIPYPEGGYANGSYIQRGSILTLPYRGDPLTPGVAATREARRLDPKDVALPEIPVQPVGWSAAKEILSRMKGPAVPDGWQGGLPFAYRLTGDKVRVRIKVKQERKLMQTYNVTGTLRGAKHRDQVVVVGAHHDAWGFGAGDPTSGTILVLEAARCFAQAVDAGFRPARTIQFAAWAAEEYGILGSVEWVEAHRERLAAGCVAYLNLDMAAMGPNARSSAAPSLKQVISESYRDTTGKELESFGNLGGGSDHIGFYCHLAIPCASLAAGGSKGVSYHSLYDNLDWYRQVVGDDYEPARMLTRVTNRLLARLSNGDLLPLDPVRYAADVMRHLGALEDRASALEFKADLGRVGTAASSYEMRAQEVREALLRAVASGKPGPDKLAAVNRGLLQLERAWLHGPGIPGRPFFRSLYAASDEDSGYAAWMLPGLRHAIEHKDGRALRRMRELYVEVFRRLERRLAAIEKLLE